MWWFYHLANGFLRFVFRIVLDYQVGGLENVPRNGPLIVAINHASFLDPLMAGAFIPREIVMMSKIENLRLPVLGTIVKLYGAFPVRRGTLDLSAMRKAMDVLRDDGVLLMAPEGTRSQDGCLRAGHDGTALLAVRTGARVLPVAVWGQKAFWSNVLRLRRTRVGLAVGESFVIRGANSRPARSVLNRMTSELMYRIAVLLPPEFRGAYSDFSNATTDFVWFDEAGTDEEVSYGR